MGQADHGAVARRLGLAGVVADLGPAMAAVLAESVGPLLFVLAAPRIEVNAAVGQLDHVAFVRFVARERLPEFPACPVGVTVEAVGGLDLAATRRGIGPAGDQQPAAGPVNSVAG